MAEKYAAHEMRLIINGKRDCKEIWNVISSNMHNLRYYSNKKLREQPGSAACIGFQFYICSNGKVVKSEVVDSKVNDTVLIDSLKNNIKSWTFPNLKNVDDTTVVYFPFCRGDYCGGVPNRILCNGNKI